MIWDGMGFFSVKGYHKLKRMKKPHRKNKCYDRYKTPENAVYGFIYLAATALVVIFEVSKYGTILSTKLDFNRDGGYKYNLNQGSPLVHGIWLNFNQTADKARAYQKRNVNSTEVMGKHPLGQMLPETNNITEWSWADKKFINSYICNHVKARYHE